MTTHRKLKRRITDFSARAAKRAKRVRRQSRSVTPRRYDHGMVGATHPRSELERWWGGAPTRPGR